MKVPAIIVTDIHINKYLAFSKNGGRDRLEQCLKVIDDVYQLAVKKNAKYILNAGDLFDTVKFLYTEVLTETIKRLKHWIEKHPDIMWLSITGNHDFATKNLPHAPAISSQQHLTDIFPNNFHLIDNDYRDVTSKIRVCGIPNYEYAEHYSMKLDEAVKRCSGMVNNIKVLMIHQKPKGMYNTHVKPDTDTEDDRYDTFDLVLCGDIHIKQKISDKFVILGNPLHRDLGDAGDEKGIWSVDLSNPVETLKFHSRAGRYPEFKYGDKSDDNSKDYIVVEPKAIAGEDIKEGVADIAKFGTHLSPKDLMINYWKQADANQDKELLQTGLSFIK